MPRAKKFSDADFDRIAARALQMELDIFDSYQDKPEYMFHEEFTRKMDRLRSDVRQGMVRAAEYSMGVTFYLKRCIAAVLLIFTLACITMPETVLAAYHKIIEVVETVFDDYTEYRYRVNDDGGIEETFRPMKLNYLPEGMEEVSRRVKSYEVDFLYENQDGQYLNIQQKSISQNNKTISILNTENMNIKKVKINGKNIELLKKDEKVYFILIHEKYRIIGQTNLSELEVIEIINKIEI